MRRPKVTNVMARTRARVKSPFKVITCSDMVTCAITYAVT